MPRPAERRRAIAALDRVDLCARFDQERDALDRIAACRLVQGANAVAGLRIRRDTEPERECRNLRLALPDRDEERRRIAQELRIAGEQTARLDLLASRDCCSESLLPAELDRARGLLAISDPEYRLLIV